MARRVLILTDGKAGHPVQGEKGDQLSQPGLPVQGASEAIAALEAQQAEMEQLLSLPENQTQENFQRYESVKHQIEQKMYEWEILND